MDWCRCVEARASISGPEQGSSDRRWHSRVIQRLVLRCSDVSHVKYFWGGGTNIFQLAPTAPWLAPMDIIPAWEAKRPIAPWCEAVMWTGFVFTGWGWSSEGDSHVHTQSLTFTHTQKKKHTHTLFTLTHTQAQAPYFIRCVGSDLIR